MTCPAGIDNVPLVPLAMLSKNSAGWVALAFSKSVIAFVIELRLGPDVNIPLMALPKDCDG
jgi:hypothetical protein